MSGVKAGKLRHYVSLQRKQIDQDPVTGEMETTWAEFARVWASLEPLSVRDFIAASAEQSEVRARITIRYRADVDDTIRVVYRGLYYRVLGVMTDKESGLEHQTLAVAEGVRLTQ